MTTNSVYSAKRWSKSPSVNPRGARTIPASRHPRAVDRSSHEEQTEPRQAELPPRPRQQRRPSRRDERTSNDPWAGHRRATELLTFLARKLVQKPEDVAVELFVDEQAQPVIELIVHPDDLGKVIGRSGRVAHALRTIVRAAAEGRVAVDILDSEEAARIGREPVVAVGRIAGIFGVRGELKCDPTAAGRIVFSEGNQLECRRGDDSVGIRLTGVRPHGKRLLIRLQGVEVPTQPQRLPARRYGRRART